MRLFSGESALAEVVSLFILVEKTYRYILLDTDAYLTYHTFYAIDVRCKRT